MQDIQKIDEDVSKELVDVLSGNNPKIDIGQKSKLIERVGIAQIIDTEGVLDNVSALDGSAVEPDRELEQIIKVFRRPSLLIQNGKFDPTPSERWNEELTRAMPVLDAVIPAIGRIEVKNHDNKDWIGTGFLIDHDLIVTNRHVAIEFVESTAPFSWRRSDDNKTIRGRIDFREEFLQPEEEEFSFSKVEYMASDGEPDLAILHCPGASINSAPLQLGEVSTTDSVVATVGYPWKDSRGLAVLESVMKRIFDNIFGVKRLAPGKIMQVSDSVIQHDCTTTGGTSGAPLLDIVTGQVVGIHFKGGRRFNSAVNVNHLKEILSSG